MKLLTPPLEGRAPLVFIALATVFAGTLSAACGSDPDLASEQGDEDGDGVADDLGVGVDANGDGELDEYETGVAVDTDGDGQPDAAGLDTNNDGIIDALDTDFDGIPDVFSETADSSRDRGGSGGTGGGGIGKIPGGQGGAGPAPGPTTDDPEICDGKDNDGNGIIDDVDAGGDGICDCLNIGTIGEIGPWSDGGNIFEEWLDTRSPIPATNLGDATLNSANLAGLDVIVVLRADTADLQSQPAHHEFSAAEVDAFEAWVRAGGGALTTIGYQNDEAAEIVNVNRLLSPLGAGYDGSDLGLDGLVTDWVSHPISTGITSIFTDNGVAVDDSNGTVVATAAGDRPALVAYQPGDGHVIVWGDEWITYDSEWVDTEGQEVELLWLNMIKWLTPQKECQVPIPPDILR